MTILNIDGVRVTQREKWRFTHVTFHHPGVDLLGGERYCALDTTVNGAPAPQMTEDERLLVGLARIVSPYNIVIQDGSLILILEKTRKLEEKSIRALANRVRRCVPLLLMTEKSTV